MPLVLRRWNCVYLDTLQSLLQKVCLAWLVCFSVDGKLTQGGWVPHGQPLILHKQLLNPIVCLALCWGWAMKPLRSVLITCAGDRW